MLIQKKIDYLSFLILLLPAAIVVGPLISDLIVTILALFICASNYKKVIEYFDNYIIFKIILIFYILNSINSLFAEHVYVSAKSAFLYIRFPLFVIASVIFLKKYPKLIVYLYYSTLITIGVVSIDAIFQFFNGKNILGFVADSRNRISGLFLDEFILGSYLARLTPIVISIYFFVKKGFNLKSLVAVIIISLLAIIISGERTSLLMMIIYWVMFTIFILKASIMNKVYLIISLFLIVALTSLSSDNLRERYFDLSLLELNDTLNSKELAQKDDDFKDQRLKHIEVSIKMFKEKPFYGHGNKMFASACFDKYFINDGRCSTHPHMILMQILVENGLIGLLVYSILSLVLFIKFVIAVRSNNDKVSSILLLILINFCPFLPSGGLYNNQISIFMFFPFIVYFLFEVNNKKIFYEKKILI
jgi:O-antigen ligase